MEANASESLASAYRQFADHVSSVTRDLSSNSSPEVVEIAQRLLDGAAGTAVRELLPQSLRTKNGIFFSGHSIAELAANLLSGVLKRGGKVGDPTCGAGDLLLACARILLDNNRSCNLSKHLYGADIHSEFVHAARARIRLLSILVDSSSGFGASKHELRLRNIKCADYLHSVSKYGRLDGLIMNPPFGSIGAPSKCKWASGKVQTAAVFLANAVEAAKTGQEIVAILPDVLRSGTNYRRWREHISTLTLVKEIKVWGQFDTRTDVDVFLLHLVKTAEPQTPKPWLDIESKDSVSLSHKFAVSIGSVVPFRIDHTHTPQSYLEVSNATCDGIAQIDKSVPFDGRMHKTPFVAVRRTSSPSDMRRLVPTLVTDPAYLAVENHLIVLQPHDSSVASCERLMKYLQKNEPNRWLNSMSRCRHITKEILSRLPLEEGV